MNGYFDFSTLIAPCSIADFVRDHWEKQFLYISRNNRKYYDNILTIHDIEALILNKNKLDKTIRLVKDGGTIRDDEWSNTKIIDARIIKLVDADRIYSLFGQGVTIILDGAERSIVRLASFCLNLERELRFRLQANLYITPHNSQGFAPHFDTHDVMILQVMGGKLWKLYDSPVYLPSDAQKHDREKHPLSEPSAEVVLEPGDLLYIPRGLIHDAQAMNVGSVHITLGLYTHTYHDLFLELAEDCRNDPALRVSLPTGLLGASAPADGADPLDLNRKLVKYLENIDLKQIMKRLDEKIVNDPRCDHRNRLGDLMQIAGLSLRSRLIRRRSIAPAVRTEGSLVKIQFSGKTLEFPLFLRPSLEVLHHGAPFTVQEIRGLINDEGKIELAKKLIQEGLLEIIDLD